jgi:hypothetical protein
MLYDDGFCVDETGLERLAKNTEIASRTSPVAEGTGRTEHHVDPIGNDFAEAAQEIHMPDLFSIWEPRSEGVMSRLLGSVKSALNSFARLGR